MEEREYVKTGIYHLNHNQKCEDKILFEENCRMAAAVIADGVSACTHASEGAETTCRAVIDFLSDADIFGSYYSEEKLGYLLSEYILYRLENKAAEQCFPVDEYASTVSLVYIDKLRDKTAVLKLGDSPVLYLNGQTIQKAVCESEWCEHLSFTTDPDAWKYMEIRYMNYEPGDTFFLYTDGFSEGAGRAGEGIVHDLIKNRDYDRLNQLLADVYNRDDLSYIAIGGESCVE